MKKKTVLIGFGKFGKSIAKELLDSNIYDLKSVFDDDFEMICNNLSDKFNLLSFDSLNNLESYLINNNIEIVFFAITNISIYRKNEIINLIIRYSDEIRILNHEFNSIHTSPSLNRPIVLQSMFDSKEFDSYKKPKNNDRILLTGGSGYIGSHLLKILLENNHKVVLLDKFLFGNNSIKKLLNHKNLEIIDGDICNTRKVWEAVEKVNSIIALAAIVGDPACGINPRETMTINYQSTKSLIDAANFYGVNKLIFASSCSVYGASKDNSLLNEDSHLNPVSLYAKTRIFSEKLILENSINFNPIILRLSTVFGFSNRMRYDLVVNLFVAQALKYKKISVNGGNQWRPFVHCYDAAMAFYKSLTVENNFSIYNVGSDKNNSTIIDISKHIKSYMKDCEVNYSKNITDERDYKVSFDRISSDLKFNVKYDLKAGIEDMIKNIGDIDKLEIEDKIYSNYKFMLNSNFGN